jgi:hypothetical protein
VRSQPQWLQRGSESAILKALWRPTGRHNISLGARVRSVALLLRFAWSAPVEDAQRSFDHHQTRGDKLPPLTIRTKQEHSARSF